MQNLGIVPSEEERRLIRNISFDLNSSQGVTWVDRNLLFVVLVMAAKR